ncbi:uncharacterized protein [Ptychodera flava]|uniref:uncharacterized protein n=1 Tax=Ptychodera flava TaxID=63121 RepID=UPI00396A8753
MTCRTHDTMVVKLLIVAVTVAWILGEVNCSGQSRTARHIPANSKFPACQPGERFAKKVSRRHLTEDNEVDVFTFKNKNGKKEFYICQRCSMCGDGIKQTEHCTRIKTRSAVAVLTQNTCMTTLRNLVSRNLLYSAPESMISQKSTPRYRKQLASKLNPERLHRRY